MASHLPQQSPLPNLIAFTKGSSLQRKARCLESVSKPKLPPQTPLKTGLKMSAARTAKTKAKTGIKMEDSEVGFKPIQDEMEEPEKRENYFRKKFAVLGILGSGSFGIVYKVQSNIDGKFYAIKESKQFFRSNSERKFAFQSASIYKHIMNSSNSEHCVSLLDVWEERNKLYLQLELCDYGTLRMYLSLNPPLPENLIWYFLNHIANALKNLKELDLVHLDLKPENLFICKDGKLKLGDFGNCRFCKSTKVMKYIGTLSTDLSNDLSLEVREHQTSPSILAGTGSYLAPELVRQSTFDFSVDMFSLGVILFEMAADVDIPFRDDGWMQLRSLHGNEPAMNDETKELYLTRSNELRTLISKLLHSNPLSRATLEDICNEKLFKEASQITPYLNLLPVEIVPIADYDLQDIPDDENPDLVLSDPKLSRNLFDSDFQDNEVDRTNRDLSQELLL